MGKYPSETPVVNLVVKPMFPETYVFVQTPPARNASTPLVLK